MTDHYSRPDLENLKRQDLQRIAKSLNIKANGKNSEIIDRILSSYENETDPQDSHQSVPDHKVSTPVSAVQSPVSQHKLSSSFSQSKDSRDHNESLGHVSNSNDSDPSTNSFSKDLSTPSKMSTEQEIVHDRSPTIDKPATMSMPVTTRTHTISKSASKPIVSTPKQPVHAVVSPDRSSNLDLDQTHRSPTAMRSPSPVLKSIQCTPATAHESVKNTLSAVHSSLVHSSLKTTPAAAHESMKSTPAAVHASMKSTPAAANESMKNTPAAVHSSMKSTPSAAHESIKNTPAAANESIKNTPAAVHSSMKSTPAAAHELMKSTPAAVPPFIKSTPAAANESTKNTPAAVHSSLNSTPAAAHESIKNTPATVHEAMRNTPATVHASVKNTPAKVDASIKNTPNALHKSIHNTPAVAHESVKGKQTSPLSSLRFKAIDTPTDEIQTLVQSDFSEIYNMSPIQPLPTQNPTSPTRSVQMRQTISQHSSISPTISKTGMYPDIDVSKSIDTNLQFYWPQSEKEPDSRASTSPCAVRHSRISASEKMTVSAGHSPMMDIDSDLRPQHSSTLSSFTDHQKSNSQPTSSDSSCVRADSISSTNSFQSNPTGTNNPTVQPQLDSLQLGKKRSNEESDSESSFGTDVHKRLKAISSSASSSPSATTNSSQKNTNRKAFDINASLKRKLPYEPKKGPIQPLDASLSSSSAKSAPGKGLPRK